MKSNVALFALLALAAAVLSPKNGAAASAAAAGEVVPPVAPTTTAGKIAQVASWLKQLLALGGDHLQTAVRWLDSIDPAILDSIVEADKDAAESLIGKGALGALGIAIQRLRGK